MSAVILIELCPSCLEMMAISTSAAIIKLGQECRSPWTLSQGGTLDWWVRRQQ
jgi:hypothetical protein